MRRTSAARREKCANCRKHAATIPWLGAGLASDWGGGWAEWWCACCIAEHQLRYARTLARRIPELERELSDEKGPCASRRGPRIAAADGGVLLG